MSTNEEQQPIDPFLARVIAQVRELADDMREHSIVKRQVRTASDEVAGYGHRVLPTVTQIDLAIAATEARPRRKVTITIEEDAQ